MTSKVLNRSFYNRDADQVAKDLLGMILVHRYREKELKVRIVETEAYLGEKDLACHSANGETKRNEVMFGPPGFAYVYFIYGMYEMFNIVTSPLNDPQAVLIRAAEPIEGIVQECSGPGKLTRALKITRAHNGLDLCGEKLFLLEGAPSKKIITTTRIGIDYAKGWKEAPLRFYDAKSPAVSKK